MYKTIIFSLIILSLSVKITFAESIFLIDGRIIDGKIVKETDKYIKIKSNSRITSVNQNQILRIIFAPLSKHRVKIVKKDGKEFKAFIVAQTAKEYYFRNELYKNKEFKILKDDITSISKIKIDYSKINGKALWTNGRISILGSYFSAQGEFQDIFSNGYGGFLSFDHGLDHLIGGKRNWIPGIDFNAGYINFLEKNNSIKGPLLTAGPKWSWPLKNTQFGFLTISALPGVSYLELRSGDEQTKSCKFALSAIIGYEYNLETISLLFQLRYMYIYDPDVVWHNVGVALGIGYRL